MAHINATRLTEQAWWCIIFGFAPYSATQSYRIYRQSFWCQGKVQLLMSTSSSKLPWRLEIRLFAEADLTCFVLACFSQGEEEDQRIERIRILNHFDFVYYFVTCFIMFHHFFQMIPMFSIAEVCGPRDRNEEGKGLDAGS